jgi:hypothetical protein
VGETDDPCINLDHEDLNWQQSTNISFNIIAECDFSQRGSQIPGQEAVKVLAIEYIHHTKQLRKFELKINKVKA